MNLSSMPNLGLVFHHAGHLTLAPDDPRAVFSGRSVGVIPLSQRDMLVDEWPNLRQFNATASTFAGRPVFGDAVVLPVKSSLSPTPSLHS
jgi:hypothetical protein